RPPARRHRSPARPPRRCRPPASPLTPPRSEPSQASCRMVATHVRPPRPRVDEFAREIRTNRANGQRSLGSWTFSAALATQNVQDRRLTGGGRAHSVGSMMADPRSRARRFAWPTAGVIAVLVLLATAVAATKGHGHGRT